MTCAVLYKVSTADECAGKSIFQNLHNHQQKKAVHYHRRLSEWFRVKAGLSRAHLPGAHSQEAGISLKSNWSKGDPFSKKCNCAAFSVQGHESLSAKY